MQIPTRIANQILILELRRVAEAIENNYTNLSNEETQQIYDHLLAAKYTARQENHNE